MSLHRICTVYIPIQYNVYDLLFRPQPVIQDRKNKFFRNLGNSKLICAHLRTGDPQTIENDFDYKNIWAIDAVWNFFKKKISSNIIYQTARIFVASDSQFVRDSAKKVFKDRIIDIEGKIMHIDFGEDDGNCQSTIKVILDWEILTECDVLVTLPWSTFSATALNRNRHRNELYAWDYQNDKKIAKIVPVKKAQKWLLKMIDKLINNCKCLEETDLKNCNETNLD